MNDAEVAAALRVRQRVFNVEMGAGGGSREAESDEFDAACRHLIVSDTVSGEVVGTYRLNTIETARSVEGFYSHSEFSIEDLPRSVIAKGVEAGRACISAEHRNTKVLYLLWKSLARFMQMFEKRFMFGCCSIFTRDPSVGEKAFHQLAEAGRFHETFRVQPRRNALYVSPFEQIVREPVDLPALFDMYLRIGAKVCGPPIIDAAFGTIDMFVVFDRASMTERCRKMFFSK